MTSTVVTRVQPAQGISVGGWIARHWFASFAVLYGLWIWLPWLAPVLMHLGWTGSGRLVYFVYSFFCHQLPQRSFFIFGAAPMYSLTQIQAVWHNTTNPLILRQFIGSASMGWKVAWSDRMVSFYGSLWVFALLWWPFRARIKALPWWGFLLLLLPIALDGGTHAISDIAGLGQGFRSNNAWLAALTQNSLPPWFYAGNALGSFNSSMRLITGTLGGLGIAWFALPHVEASFVEG